MASLNMWATINFQILPTQCVQFAETFSEFVQERSCKRMLARMAMTQFLWHFDLLHAQLLVVSNILVVGFLGLGVIAWEDPPQRF